MKAFTAQQQLTLALYLNKSIPEQNFKPSEAKPKIKKRFFQEKPEILHMKFVLTTT